MPTTYIDLCNQVLRRLNEVEIVAGDFPSVRGVHALVKDAVQSSVARLNQSEYSWPFNAAEHTTSLVAGQTEYTWPVNYKIADWNSFQIQKNDSLGVGYKSLQFIERDEWYSRHRDADYTAGSQGRDVPDFVFASHGSGFGVTPAPNRAYTIRFRYYQNFTDLTNASDECRIPSSFDSVLVDGAMYFLYMFKDNIQASQSAYVSFESGLKNLQSIYINNYTSVRDTRIQF
jgi:hypothetical protein